MRRPAGFTREDHELGLSQFCVICVFLRIVFVGFRIQDPTKRTVFVSGARPLKEAQADILARPCIGHGGVQQSDLIGGHVWTLFLEYDLARKAPWHDNDDEFP